jgi:hypothetical protein
MAALAAQRAVLSVEKHALADMRLHVAFGGPGEFARAVTKGTIRIGNVDRAPARTNRAFLDVSLRHLSLVKSTII